MVAVPDDEQRGGLERGPVRTPVEARSNRVHWFAGRVHEVLDEVTAGGVPVSELNPAETAEAVTELCRLASRIEGLKATLVAHGDRVDVARESGATSTGAWLAVATRTVRGRANGLVRLAKQLDAAAGSSSCADAAVSFEATSTALLEGRVDVDQAQVITDAVTALPAFVGPRDRRRAEAHLLGEATRHDAKRLRLLARHLLHVIDPEAADAELARRLDREEADA
ncbi:MAG: hypothetical protein QOK15_2617, partial [Nocardioidaceae bacterium]|nr:hypothetical protein [Nocardioidaceae bacterium]